MQQIPLTDRSDARKSVEDFFDFLGTLRRGWRLVAACVAIPLTLAIIYLARAKPVYQATARLLVLQHGGQPLNVTNGATNNNLFQSVDGYSNSLATHVMIIRSPLIVERALASAGLKNISAGSVIGGLSVKVPDESARVLELSYKAGSRGTVVRLVDSVIKSYDRFLRDNYQKNANDALSLITKARDELSSELKKLEREYLEYRQKSPAHVSDGEGRTFITRRLDQWDQAINQAMLRSLQLKTQLELGRKLAEDGAGIDTVTNAIGQLTGVQVAPNLADAGPASVLSPERLEAELGEVEFQRHTAERLLEHLRAEQAGAVYSLEVGDDEIARAFYAEPAASGLSSELNRARAKYDQIKRISRLTSEPALVAAERRVKELESEIGRLWQRRKPAILAELAQADGNLAIRQAAGELMALRAKEATLHERLDEVKSRRLRQLHQEHDRLARQYGPQHARVQAVREQIARIEGRSDEAPTDPRQAQTRALLGSIEQGLRSIEVLRAEVERRFERDLAESKRTEIGLLTESNLRNNLERQRALFYSVVDQLKQAQLVSDFGSVTAQVLNPPTATESRPPVILVLLAAVVAGCGLGAGAVYVVDLMDARIRSLPEIRRLMDLRVLGVVPQLPREKRKPVTVGLISHMRPRSPLAESFKAIRTSIDLLRRNWKGQVFLVTSPRPSDGKSSTASNLAISLAHTGRKVLLIDADLRRPSQHAIYDLHRDPGLTQVLEDQLPYRLAVQQTPIENLDLLAAGPEVPNPAELLATPRLASFVGEVRQDYDFVIFDSSPLLAVTDPSIIATVIDGIVVVVQASITRRHDVEWTMDLLKAIETPVLGLVFNGFNAGQGGYGYEYLYGYGSYGRSGASTNGDDLASGPRPDRDGSPAPLPVVGTNGTADHPKADY